VYARLDRPDPRTGRRRLRWTNAGHLPPVVVSSSGRSRVLGDAGPADTILGVRPDAPRRDQQVRLDPGDTDLFFTDGLIERRGESLDDGIQRLRDALERYHHRPVEELLDSVLGEVGGDTHADDLALLAVHLPLLAPPAPDGLNGALGGKADPREHVAALAVR
jgi:serine phosphatase RsbU (regulator of sigma subunit)